jgi:hypothetical protein
MVAVMAATTNTTTSIGNSERSSPLQGNTPMYDSTLTSSATDPAIKRLRTTPGASIP